ncbi:hypothetical protein DFP72DRAFT_858661 [Ephemerocybe angulata]|uniref:CxC2-like cysteine cluster KDZ transposase-associated domain-containing protein n=1 Tax=Ephemerocybe angulata TaxID=980116 RepID=A0A8H6HAQ0_9AGAR|nr:hypothetical protein DFP72DRAFT_858661 [Tulosesus angulatus]
MGKQRGSKDLFIDLEVKVKPTKRGLVVGTAPVKPKDSLHQAPKRRKRKHPPPHAPSASDPHNPNPFDYPGASEPLYYESIFEPPDGKTSQGNSTHDYLKAWLGNGKYSTYLDRLLTAESAPKTPCVRCQTEEATWRCLGCSHNPHLCTMCCRITHRRTPFHRVEYWNGKHFQPGWLWHVGVIICLGHKGNMCPTYHRKLADLEQRALELNNCTELPPLTKDDPTYGAKPATSMLGHGNFVLFVHSNGFHHLPVYPCICDVGVRLPDDEQYLEAGYFPSTWTTIQTAFSLELLKDYHLTKVESKMSTENFCDILKRKTNFAFPSNVDRARELSRVWQMYNFLILLKRHGFGHDKRGRKPEKGELALYCAVCPQPGINLPPNWRDLTELWLFKRYIVIDGNFKLHHLLIRGEDKGISLIAGAAYMIEKGYMDRVLKNAPESKQEATCSEYKAVQDKDKMKKGYDASGVFGSACARHGCFCGGSLVDLQKGERQANADLSLNEAFHTTNAKDCPGALLAYDINCQFCVHVRERIKAADHLTIPEDLDITYLIGLFHIHGHGEICLPRFASTFLPGAGMASGEIIESLWSILNQAAKICKTMTATHRRDVLDACVSDINWKKLVTIDTYLARQLLKARVEKQKAEDDFRLINETVSPTLIKRWKEDMERVNKERKGSDVSAMDEYLPKQEKVKTKKAVQSSMMVQEQKTRTNVGLANWLASGIEIQETQLAVRSLAGGIRNATEGTITALDLQKKREALIKRIDAWYKVGELLFPGIDLSATKSEQEDTKEPCICEDKCICPPHYPDPDLGFEEAENVGLSLPSDFSPVPGPLATAAIAEGLLRVAQANEVIEALRNHVTRKSSYYRANREFANGTRDRTRKYDSINALEKLMVSDKKRYEKARWAMERLGILDQHPQFQKLERAHTKAITAIYSPNAPGQRNEGLSWIWTATGIDPTDKSYLEEVYRVNWIRAKSRADRWSEEVTILGHEMEWFLRFCKYQEDKCLGWAELEEVGMSDGHSAYAHRQADMWIHALTTEGCQSLIYYSSGRILTALGFFVLRGPPDETKELFHDRLKEELMTFSFLCGTAMLVEKEPRSIIIPESARQAAELAATNRLMDWESAYRLGDASRDLHDRILPVYEGGWWQPNDPRVDPIRPEHVFEWWSRQKRAVHPLDPLGTKVFLDVTQLTEEELESARKITDGSVRLLDAQITASSTRLEALAHRIAETKRLRQSLEDVMQKKAEAPALELQERLDEITKTIDENQWKAFGLGGTPDGLIATMVPPPVPAKDWIDLLNRSEWISLLGFMHIRMQRLLQHFVEIRDTQVDDEQWKEWVNIFSHELSLGITLEGLSVATFRDSYPCPFYHELLGHLVHHTGSPRETWLALSGGVFLEERFPEEVLYREDTKVWWAHKPYSTALEVVNLWKEGGGVLRDGGLGEHNPKITAVDPEYLKELLVDYRYNVEQSRLDARYARRDVVNDIPIVEARRENWKEFCRGV